MEKHLSYYLQCFHLGCLLGSTFSTSSFWMAAFSLAPMPQTSDTRQASLWLLYLFSCYRKTQELVSFGQLILLATGIAQKLLPLNKLHLPLIWSWSETLPLCPLYCFHNLSFESVLKYHSASFYLQMRIMPQLPQEHWAWNLLTLTLKQPLSGAMAVFDAR